MTLKGIIFDMDGVLVDSEEFICRAAMTMFAEHGVTVAPHDFVPFIGAGEDRFLGGVAHKYHFLIDTERDKKRTYEIYLDLIKGKLRPLPGVMDFFTRLGKHAMKLALATSADRIKMAGNLTEIGLPESRFHYIVTGNDIDQKKPDPEIFLKAADGLGLAPPECLIIEDSVNGVRAGRAAGAICLGIGGSFSAEELGAHYFARDLNHLPEELSRALFSGR